MNKVICIYPFYGLTLNKIYYILDKDNNSYQVINDRGEKFFYLKRRFKLLSDFRNERINEILEDE